MTAPAATVPATTVPAPAAMIRHLVPPFAGPVSHQPQPVPSSSGSSAVIFYPSTFLPFPHMERKPPKMDRRRRRSDILTDSPVKTALLAAKSKTLKKRPAEREI